MSCYTVVKSIITIYTSTTRSKTEELQHKTLRASSIGDTLTIVDTALSTKPVYYTTTNSLNIGGTLTIVDNALFTIQQQTPSIEDTLLIKDKALRVCY